MVRQCLRCRTDEYHNRNLVMMVNECGHPLCKQCVEKVFAKNTQNRCPQEGCEKQLKRSGYRVQLFDDPKIEKENTIRRRISKIFNLQEDDFPTLRAYNDYLERTEDVVFNLSNGVDVAETEAGIKRFREENADSIERNRKRLTPDEMRISQILEEEDRRGKLAQEMEATQRAEHLEHLTNPKSVIDELRASDLPAEVLLDRERKKKIEMEMLEKELALRRKQEKLERREKAMFGRWDAKGGGEVEQPYYHELPPLDVNGPVVVSSGDDFDRYLKHVREVDKAGVAGGYLPQTGCYRALLDAYQDLFFA